MIKEAVVKHCPGHKNSQGLDAPWCIYSEEGKIISSHSSKNDATKHLRDIEGHKKSASQNIIAYHGSNNPINKFDNQFSAQGVFWFSEDKDRILRGESGASSYNYIIEVELFINKYAGWDEYDKLSLGEIEHLGFDSIKLDNDWIIFNDDNIKILNIEKINKKSSLEPDLSNNSNIYKEISIFYRLCTDKDKPQLIDSAIKKYNITEEFAERIFSEVFPNGLKFVKVPTEKTCNCASDKTCNCTEKKKIHSNIEKVISNITDFNITDEFVEDLYHTVEKKENIDSFIDKYNIKNDAFVLVLYSLLEELHDVISKK